MIALTPGIVASVSNGRVPFGASLMSYPRETSSSRNDSRIPVASITISSSIAAAIATPNTASMVRPRWRMSDACASVALTQRPNNARGGVRTSRSEARSPTPTPSTKESPTASATIGGVMTEKWSGVR
jgi:hypothetical protein